MMFIFNRICHNLVKQNNINKIITGSKGEILFCFSLFFTGTCVNKQKTRQNKIHMQTTDLHCCSSLRENCD